MIQGSALDNLQKGKGDGNKIEIRDLYTNTVSEIIIEEEL